MKKTAYALCGSLMLTTAVLVRSLAGGGSELIAPLLLIGSVDLPANTKGAAR